MRFRNTRLTRVVTTAMTTTAENMYSTAGAVPTLVPKPRSSPLGSGKNKRADVPGLLVGNTAERMFGTVDFSVYALKSNGFISCVAPKA